MMEILIEIDAVRRFHELFGLIEDMEVWVALNGRNDAVLPHFKIGPCREGFPSFLGREELGREKICRM